MIRSGITVFAGVLILCVLFALPLLAGEPKKAAEVITLDAISDQYEPVFFTHERHVSMAGKCDPCHHEHGNGAAFPCKSCHTLDASQFRKSVSASFGACRNCHSKADPAAPQIVSLKVAYHSQCFSCHRGMGKIGTDPVGCTELCHAQKLKTASARK